MGTGTGRAALVVVLMMSAGVRAGASDRGESGDAAPGGIPEAAVQGVSGVRAGSPGIAAAIERAREGSATFRQLVATIGATDGIVYVHEGLCLRGVLACLLHTVTQAGPNRILHIRVDPRRTGLDLMVTIGHELTHAAEVLSQPSLVDKFSVRLYYELLGPTDRLAFETKAAIGNELTVRKELKKWNRAQAAQSHQPPAIR